MTNFKSDIILGEEYIDEQTGFVGTATAIYFFQHACERVNLESRLNDEGKIIVEAFDAPRLRSTKTKLKAASDRPGGPGRSNEGSRPGPR